MEIEIREATQKDLAGILELYRHFDRPEDPPLSAERLEQIWQGFCGSEFFKLLVAFVDNEMASTCALTIIPNWGRGGKPYALIENVVTRTNLRGQGIGSRLMEFALHTAWQYDCYKCMLMTGRNHFDNHRFYKRLGFSQNREGFVTKHSNEQPQGGPNEV